MDSRNSKIFCAIFNYGKRENTIELFNMCSPVWDTVVFDSYSLEHNFKDNSITKEDIPSARFLDNILCGGLTVKAFEYVVNSNYEYILIINSDVKIDSENFNELSKAVNMLPYSKIGIYEPSTTEDSCVMGKIGRFPYTWNYFKQDGKRFKTECRAEGWLYAIRVSLIREVYPFLDVEKNKFGWGIGKALLRLSEIKGYKNVIDNDVFVFHPKGTGYDVGKALAEWHRFDKFGEKIGIPYYFLTVGYATREHNEEIKNRLTEVFGNQNVYIEKICNEETKLTLTEAYNQIINESRYDTVILVHDDIEFTDLDDYKLWPSELIQRIFFNNKDCGILGIAPRCILEPEIVTRNYTPEYFFSEKDSEKGVYYNYFGGEIERFSMEISKDAVVDGMFTAIRKDRIKNLYDENLKGFHCYDIDFCLSNYLAGVGVYTTKSMHLIHEKTPEKNFEQYEKEKEFIFKKYGDLLPIKLEK